MDNEQEQLSDENNNESHTLSYNQSRLTEFAGKIEWFPAAEKQFKQTLVSVLHTVTFILSTIIGIVLMANGDKLLSVIPTAVASKVIMHYAPIDVEELLSD